MRRPTNPCEEGYARCVECGECKSDNVDFYDGLRCKICAEAEEEEIKWHNIEMFELGDSLPFGGEDV